MLIISKLCPLEIINNKLQLYTVWTKVSDKFGARAYSQQSENFKRKLVFEPSLFLNLYLTLYLAILTHMCCWLRRSTCWWFWA